MCLHLFEAQAILPKLLSINPGEERLYFPQAPCFTERQDLCLCAEIRQFIIQSQRNGQRQGQTSLQFQINCFPPCLYPVNET